MQQPIVEAEIDTELVDLFCDSDTVPEWYFSKRSGYKREVYMNSGRELTITDLSLQKSGYYKCYGYTKGQGFLAIIRLKVYGNIAMIHCFYAIG